MSEPHTEPADQPHAESGAQPDVESPTPPQAERGADVLLEVEGLSVAYPDGTEALHGLSLCVAAGERVGLIGANGSGKTSLLLAILGAVGGSGRVVVDGIELTRRSRQDVLAGCGMTFQYPDDQLFMPTLLEDVAFGPLNQGCQPAEAIDRAESALAAVGLAGLSSRSGHHLSGGQKQLAALATVLSMRVKLLLLDEPGASLDARSRRRLLDVLRARPEAMLLATHDLDLVGRLCQRVVVLEAGRCVADGGAETLLANEALLERYGLK